MDALVGDDDALRDRLEALLLGGLDTEWQARAYTSEAVNDIIARLQAIAHDDHAELLRVAGFTARPYVAPDDEIAQACETCMYYVVHRRFCDLPELRLPAKPEWSCRLWRI